MRRGHDLLTARRAVRSAAWLFTRRGKRGHGLRGLIAQNRAVAAVEFAILAPVLILMLLGMICFGLYLVYLHELQEIASSAARASVAGLNQAERDTLAKQFVTSAVTNSSLLSLADLTVTTSTSGTPATFYAVTLDYQLKDTPPAADRRVRVLASRRHHQDVNNTVRRILTCSGKTLPVTGAA